MVDSLFSFQDAATDYGDPANELLTTVLDGCGSRWTLKTAHQAQLLPHAGTGNSGRGSVTRLVFQPGLNRLTVDPIAQVRFKISDHREN